MQGGSSGYSQDLLSGDSVADGRFRAPSNHGDSGGDDDGDQARRKRHYRLSKPMRGERPDLGMDFVVMAADYFLVPTNHELVQPM